MPIFAASNNTIWKLLLKRITCGNCIRRGKTTDKKYRFQSGVIRKYIRIIDLMIDQPDILALKKYNGLNYEVLKDDKAGISSIRVNDQYRIEFTVTDNGIKPLITVCNILKLSNYYK